MKKIILFITIITLSNGLVSQPSRYDMLDSAFGNQGKVIVEKSSVADQTTVCVQTQPGGKIIVATTSFTLFSISRYFSNGKLDQSFGKKGYINVRIKHLYDCKIQSDGKIIVLCDSTIGARKSAFFLLRYKANGIIDSTFGEGGSVSVPDNVQSIAIAFNDDIIVAGHDNTNINKIIILARYYFKDGKANENFGLNGHFSYTAGFYQVVSIFPKVAIDSKNRIIIGANSTVIGNGVNNYLIFRLKQNGILDSSFNGNGLKTFTYQYPETLLKAIAIQKNDKIIIGSNTVDYYSDFLLSRVNSNGTIDSAFGANGFVITDFAYNTFPRTDELKSLAIQDDNKIIAGGFSKDRFYHGAFALARYNYDGNPDSSFGFGGKVMTKFDDYDSKLEALDIQSDGKIIGAGETQRSTDYLYRTAFACYNKERATKTQMIIAYETDLKKIIVH